MNTSSWQMRSALVTLLVAGTAGIVLGIVALTKHDAPRRPPDTNVASESGKGSPTKAAEPMASQDIIKAFKDSGSPSFQQAFETVKKWEFERPGPFIELLPKFLDALVTGKRFEEVESLATRGRSKRPEKADLVAKCLFYQSRAYVGQQKYDQALAAAKSYYFVAPLKDTPAAIDLIATALSALPSDGAARAKRFRSEQAAGIWHAAASTTQPAGSVEDATADSESRGTSIELARIDIDASIYDKEAESLRKTVGGFSSTLAAFNMLLAAGHLDEAEQCLNEIAASEKTDEGKIRTLLEAYARLTRDRDLDVRGANEFISALRSTEKPELPKCLARANTAQLTAAAGAMKLGAPPSMATQRPDLEELRAGGDNNYKAAKPIVVTVDSIGNSEVQIEKLADTHFRLDFPRNSMGWFLIRVENAANRIVRFDVHKTNVPRMINWWAFNPLVSHISDVNAPELYLSGKDSPQLQRRGSNGVDLSAPAGQSWQWIKDSWIDSNNTVSFVHRFDADRAFLSHRVPHTPEYMQRRLQTFQESKVVQIVEVGRSAQDRPLHVARISEDPEIGKPSQKPCALIYAGEHADEHDAMSVAEGALAFLAGDSVEAKSIRKRMDLLVIPMLDPDATAAGKHNGILLSFNSQVKSVESIAFANWFRGFIGRGHRIDAVLDCHAGMEADGDNVGFALAEGVGHRGALSTALHRELFKALSEAGCTVTPVISARGWTPNRLGGWLSRYYGPIVIVPESNSMAPNHLNMSRLAGVGEGYVRALDRFFDSPKGGELKELVSKTLKERSSLIAPLPRADDGSDALSIEAESNAKTSYPQLAERRIP